MAGQMGRAQFLETVAALVAGLQVPASMGGPRVLGAAYEPWKRLHEQVWTAGWHDSTEYLAAFERAVGLEES